MPSLIDTKIAACASWEEFCVLANSQENEKDKGDLFERLTQIYLQTHPTYRTKIKKCLHQPNTPKHADNCEYGGFLRALETDG